MELKEKMEDQLGDDFNIKEFHDKISVLKIELIIEKKNELMDKIKRIT